MIELINTKEGEVFSYSIVYLFGKCIDFAEPSIEIIDSTAISIKLTIINNYIKVKLNSNIKLKYHCLNII